MDNTRSPKHHSRALTVGSLLPSASHHLQQRSFGTQDQRGIKGKHKQHVFKINPSAAKSILDLALAQGISMDFKCKKGECGRCQFQVLEGQDRLTPLTKKEQSKLGEKCTEGYRLACQTRFA